MDYVIFKPIYFLLWLLATFYIMQQTFERLGFEFGLYHLSAFRNATICVCLVWIFLRLKREILKLFVWKSRQRQILIDPSSLNFIGKIASAIIVFIGILFILDLLGIDIIPLIAFGGIGAAALGFSAKDIMANFFGGLMLHVARPFVVGDLLAINKEQIEGYVEEIGWYMTCIRNMEKEMLYMPNAVLSSMVIKNISEL